MPNVVHFTHLFSFNVLQWFYLNWNFRQTSVLSFELYVYFYCLPPKYIYWCTLTCRSRAWVNLICECRSSLWSVFTASSCNTVSDKNKKKARQNWPGAVLYIFGMTQHVTWVHITVICYIKPHHAVKSASMFGV